MCSKYRVKIIFYKPAVHRTLLTIYGVDLYIIKKENELSYNRQANTNETGEC